jgi:hypothetical protein
LLQHLLLFLQLAQQQLLCGRFMKWQNKCLTSSSSLVYRGHKSYKIRISRVSWIDVIVCCRVGCLLRWIGIFLPSIGVQLSIVHFLLWLVVLSLVPRVRVSDILIHVWHRGGPLFDDGHFGIVRSVGFLFLAFGILILLIQLGVLRPTVLVDILLCCSLSSPT